MVTLYDYELSGNCYKVRLLLALLRIPHVRRYVDFYPGREQRQPWFLALNPLGQLPVLADGELVLWDAQAILVHLASQYDDSGTWYPRERVGQVAVWLAFAQEITVTASAARLHDTMFYACDIEACRAAAHRLFRILDQRLWLSEQAGGRWLCGGDEPTIADLACFPYVMLSEEGGISRRDYPAIRRWTDRVRQLARFVPMPGILSFPQVEEW